jgi:hypothetical protein
VSATTTATGFASIGVFRHGGRGICVLTSWIACQGRGIKVKSRSSYDECKQQGTKMNDLHAHESNPPVSAVAQTQRLRAGTVQLCEGC